MLTEVPTPSGLRDAGLGYLNMAWAEVMSLLADADAWAENRQYAEDGEDPVAAHWASSQRHLAAAGALVHQGAELLVKGRIASVSPYLLLDRAWSDDTATRDVEFGDLKTVESQALIRIHNSVCSVRLSQQFRTDFEVLRKRRNKLIHGLSSSAIPDAITIAKDVLAIVTEVEGAGSWPRIRREFELGDPNAAWDHHGAIRAGLIGEFCRIVERLTKVECERYLGFPKEEERFKCPRCRRDDLFPDLPLAVRRRPSDTNVHCIACGQDSAVGECEP